jgi:threonine synthase
VFAEPAAAAAYAGLLKASERDLLSPDERVVVLITGNGLKDVESAQKAVGAAQRVGRSLDDVARIVERLGL